VQRDVLEAVAHLEGVRPNHYAHQVLVEHLAGLATHPAVEADLANRRRYREAKAGVSALTDKRRGIDQAG
jgi:hypothetical protein